jgi:DNA-binding transcriptional regulator YbjK
VPKVVDHEARREELAGALWRVIERDGIEAASLRRVAREAGWSVGALRHYFATQSQLLAFAMELVVRRVADRVAALDDPRAILHQVLPLDAERRAEMHVWLAFTSQALADPALRELRDEAHDRLRELCRAVAAALGAPHPDRDGERLHALIDGLALHAVLAPDVTTPRRQVELLDAQLALWVSATNE